MVSSINSKNELCGFGQVGALSGIFRFNLLSCSPLLSRKVEIKICSETASNPTRAIYRTHLNNVNSSYAYAETYTLSQ